MAAEGRRRAIRVGQFWLCEAESYRLRFPVKEEVADLVGFLRRLSTRHLQPVEARARPKMG
jgi:hypothetical protein